MPHRIEVLQADITSLDVDAIVNAAKPTLLGGVGFLLLGGFEIGHVRARQFCDVATRATDAADAGNVPPAESTSVAVDDTAMRMPPRVAVFSVSDCNSGPPPVRSGDTAQTKLSHGGLG